MLREAWDGGRLFWNPAHRMIVDTTVSESHEPRQVLHVSCVEQVRKSRDIVTLVRYLSCLYIRSETAS